MDAAAELGRNPVSKHQIQPENRDEQADAGRDCRNRLARPNSQARTNADREIFLFPDIYIYIYISSTCKSLPIYEA